MPKPSTARTLVLLRAAVRTAALLLLLGPSHAAGDGRATAPTPPTRSLGALAADPNLPAPTAMFRDTLRATVGYPIPLLHRGPFRFELPVLIELHDESVGNAFPSELWRGRAGFALHWDREVGADGTADEGPTTTPGHALGVSVLLTHESDHDTNGRYDAYLFLNDLGVRALWRAPLRSWSALIGAAVHWHFFTCTRIDIDCYDATFGDAQAFEANADIVIDGAGGRPAFGRIVFFGAIHGATLLGTSSIVTELRLATHLGFRYRRQDLGALQLFGTALVGNDVGLLRGEREVQLGAALRWTP